LGYAVRAAVIRDMLKGTLFVHLVTSCFFQKVSTGCW